MRAVPPPLALEPPGHHRPYRVEFVCTGNICRSPSADVVLAHKAAEAGLDVEVTSSGIADYHIGKPMDDRSARHLDRAGYDPTRHRARQVDIADLRGVDLVLAMDGGHLADLLSEGLDPTRVMLFREFDPVDTGSDTPDPYYGGDAGFGEVLDMVQRTCDELVAALARVQ